MHQLFTLVVEPNRDPRLGRNQEGYSEDPWLCARFAETIVRAVQGDDPSAGDRCVAGLCHYPGQSEPVSGLERGAMEVSERKLRTIFLPPWEAGIRDAGALGVMATYPAIDGDPGSRLEVDPHRRPARRAALRRPRPLGGRRPLDAPLRGHRPGREARRAARAPGRGGRGHLVRAGLHARARRRGAGGPRGGGARRPGRPADPAPEGAARPLRAAPGRPRPRARDRPPPRTTRRSPSRPPGRGSSS